ncbi:MAG: hypothetical protein GF401_10765 [Chitinivibrionales bacterium]|nr:hypothetical protein [Chitinivibrionales bacterium]
MDGVSSVAQSVQALNQVLQSANKETVEMAEKMVKVNVEMALGAELGKGGSVDVSA